MPKVGPKVMVERKYMIWSSEMNLPRKEMSLDSSETRRVTNFMTEQEAIHGSGVYGWDEDRTVAAMQLSNPSNQAVLSECGKTAQTLIEEEMRARTNLYAVYSTSKTGNEHQLAAFREEFCEPDGTLFDLRKADLSKVYLGNEGHHRGMQSMFDAHCLCLGMTPPRKFSILVPVKPAVFTSMMELMEYQAMGNAADGSQVRLKTIDYAKIAIRLYHRLGSGTEFRRLMGEMSPAVADEEGKKVKDAGGTAVLAWNIAELEYTFPKLGVWSDLSRKKDDLDFVNISDLGVNPKPDWMKSVPTILQLSDRKKMEAYMNKFKKSAPQSIIDKYEAGEVWGEAEVAEWWEGKKRNKNKGVVPSAIEKTVQVSTEQVDNWTRTCPNLLGRRVCKALLDKQSTDFKVVVGEENRLFNDVTNATVEILENTSYGEKIKEICLRLSALYHEGIDANKALDDAIALLQGLFKTEETADKKSAPKSKKSAETK